MELTASMEDYLEAIHVLSQRNQVVRIKDIAKHLGVRMPSVTGAVKSLSGRGLVWHKRYEDVELTAEGEEIAKRIWQRHKQLRDFLIDVLAMPADVAENEACKLEHAMAANTLQRLVKFAEFMRKFSNRRPECLGHFRYYLEHGETPEECNTIGPAETRESTSAESSSKQVTLNDLQPGEKAAVVRVTGRGPIRQRLMDMGLIPGEEVEVQRAAPLGDPIDIKVKGYHLSIRRSEARHVYVKQ